MKGKFITLVLPLGFLAAFGVFMHSPPSILDGLTGATPKAKRAAQMAAPLEGNYLRNRLSLALLCNGSL